MAPWFHRPQYKSIDRKPDGVFILDSFGMTGLDSIRMRTYIPSALEYVYLRTGNLCVAAQCGEGYEDDGYAELFDGATLMAMMMVMYDGDCSNSAYEDMFCVIISMGKDVYKLAKDKARVYKDDEAVATIATGMQDVCRYCQEFIARECLVVYGGTQEVWGYEQKFGEIYDEYVDAVVKKLRDGGTNVIKGIHLGQLQTVDRIGHVHVKSLEAVFDMYALWACIARGRPWTSYPKTPYPRTSYPRSKL